MLSAAAQAGAEQNPATQSPSPADSGLILDQPLTLDQALELALARNPDMHIANERIARAEAQIGESLAAFYPQLKARLAYEYSDNPARAFGMIVSQRRFTQQDFLNINNPGGTTDFRPEVVGTISLFRGGQDYQRSKVAELGKEISTLQRAVIKNNLMQAVTDSYYALLVAQENKIIADRSIDAVSRELQNTEIRFHGGTALKSDVLSLKVRLARSREASIRADNAIEMARTVLRTILDLSPASPVQTVAQEDQELPGFPATLEELFRRAETARPEIQAADRQVETRQRQVKIAQGEHLPRVDAFINYGINSEDIAFSAKRDNLTAGVALEMDLFSGFGTQQRIKKAERQLAEATEQAHKIRLQVNQEVKNAYLALQEALQRYRVTEASVTSADEALRLVTEQHRAGTATVTRYIESEAARDQANARTIAARYDTFRAEALLKRALGEWQ
ncbi:TolC family protein [Thiolapillus sp.]|uniref:TolC family protein n=1 Tax=Thiolapillus sp. TaxID=2017437 RepID=UPI003AF7BF5F